MDKNKQNCHRPLPKGHDKPLSEGKFHYRYHDPYDSDSIECIDCHAPYGARWATKEYYAPKNHYTCTFDSKFQYNNGYETITKNVSKKFVCFPCRNIIKRPLNLYWNYSYHQTEHAGPWNTTKRELRKDITFQWPKCYKCNQHMICVNSKFEVPKKQDDKSWNYKEQNWNNNSKMTYDEYTTYRKDTYGIID